MTLLAIIAARSGSKSVKNKNIRELSGKPLIAHSIEQATRWGKYDKLIVSTDSQEIAEIASRYGAEVPFIRPAELATDTACKLDVLRHALVSAEEYYEMSFEAVLDVDVTAPVRTVADIENIVQIFQETSPDCVFSVVESRKSPYFNMVECGQSGEVRVCKPLPRCVTRRQDVPVVYAMNTSLYVYKRAFLLDAANKLPYSGKTEIYEMPEITAVDIDSELDFAYIEFLVNTGKVIL